MHQVVLHVANALHKLLVLEVTLVLHVADALKTQDTSQAVEVLVAPDVFDVLDEIVPSGNLDVSDVSEVTGA